MKWTRDQFEVDTATERLDYARVAEMIGSAYWAVGRSHRDIETAWRNTTVQFGLYDLAAGGRLVGLARVLSDKVAFARLLDVFVDPGYRGRGLGVFLMACIMAHPDCAGVKNFTLATEDAHGLYRKFGFDALKTPEREMSRKVDRP